jgi:type IX secretion system PorP/SprF family membrane protein
MKLPKYIGILLLMFVTVTVMAQQKPLYSQYMFNTFLINPAAAGAEGFTSVNFTGRTQWLGLANAPQTQCISAQTRVLKNSFIAKALSLRKKYSKRSKSGRVGLGAYFYNDIYGAIRRTGGQGTYAYHIPLRQSQLSFGLSVEMFQYKLDKGMVQNTTALLNDAYINNNSFNKFIFDGNFGAQFTAPLWNAGLSISDLFNSSLNVDFGNGSNVSNRLERNYNITGGYKFEVNRFVLIEPSTLLKFTERGVFQMDLTARAYYREDYWGGLSYRTGAGSGSIIVLAGVRVNKYYFGYAFDYTMSDISTNTLGSHEFMLSLKFGENARRYRWLNRY